MDMLKKNWPRYSFGQPAHLVAALAVLAAAYFMFPSESEKKTLVAWIVHMLCFASYLGTQIWVTFIAGLSMFHALPRHTFADVQSVLFPRYFIFSTILAILNLSSYIYLNPIKTLSPKQELELAVLAISAAMSFINIFIAGPLIDTLVKRNKIEKEAGIGHQIGHIDKKLFEGNANYQKLSKSFLHLHGISSLANLLALICNLVHIYFLAIHLNS